MGVYIYHHALVLKCLCIDAVLERNRNWGGGEQKGRERGGLMMRALGYDYILTSYIQHHFVKSYSAHYNTNENNSPELKNTPYWIVGLTELHEKSIKNQKRGMNK